MKNFWLIKFNKSIREKKIIRDPSQQLPNYITNIECKVCDKETRFLSWKNGTDRCEKPHTIYTLSGIATISPVYTFKFRHEALGADAKILQKLTIEIYQFVYLIKQE